MATVLLATLGESPVVVTSMVYMLENRNGNDGPPVKIDQIDVLHSEGPAATYVEEGYERWIKRHLSKKYQLNSIPLGFEDANSEELSYLFLQKLVQELDRHEQAGNTVYLSLAGGRKNMSALLGIVAPLYPCVRQIYHLLDEYEGTGKATFLSLNALSNLNATQEKSLLEPEQSRLKLVEIPYREDQYIEAGLRSRLKNLTPEGLEKLYAEMEIGAEGEASLWYGSLWHGSKPLVLEMTEHAARQYQDLKQAGNSHAKRFYECFMQMRNLTRLRGFSGTENSNGAHGTVAHSWQGIPYTFHFYKRRRTAERPFYYTADTQGKNKDVAGKKDAEAARVIICHLEVEVEGSYASGEKIIKQLAFPLQSKPFEEFFASSESILLVPSGPTPMIATQLYSLLSGSGTQEADKKFKKVVLLFPDANLSSAIRTSYNIVKEAFKRKGVEIQAVFVRGYGDIDSTPACQAYQEKLEETISNLQDAYPGVSIELALSGGRKGMAALALFAAQNTGLHHVYHTLITDERLSEQVLEETDLEELYPFHDEAFERLFLEAYADQREKFVIFKIPVIPSQRYIDQKRGQQSS